MTHSDRTACPCGNGSSLAGCCGRYHAGEPAPTPEALMRSRYSAFVLELAYRATITLAGGRQLF
ncbi:YchJ family protein [Halomonas faecis]|uniref:hypothetical protein n=1 Tax=Halomonas faecis TaxID=1562110 RepID=UPI001F0974AE|nr:hypothetical protein [Halomonas faecis]